MADTPPKPPAPKKGRQLLVRVDDELMGRVEKKAAERRAQHGGGWSISSIVRALLDAWAGKDGEPGEDFLFPEDVAKHGEAAPKPPPHLRKRPRRTKRK